MSFVVYYSHGKVFSAGEPSSGIPARDVQVILQDDADGPTFQSGSDYYVWQDDRWQGVDEFGRYDWLLDCGFYKFEDFKHQVLEDEKWRKLDKDIELYLYLMDNRFVLFGRTISREEYQVIYQRAKVEKSTWRSGERRAD